MRKKQVKPQRIGKRPYKTTYTEEAMQKAYDEIKIKHLPTERVAKKYGIPAQTLRDRVKGLVDPNKCAPGRESLFSRDEELILVEHVEVLSQMGYGYTNIQLQHLAGDLAYDFGRRKSNKALTSKWLYAFLGRWTDRITSRNPQSLDSNRAKHSTPEKIQTYYENLEKVLDEHHLKDKPQYIYNLDETGIQPEHRPPHIIGSVNHKAQAITSPRATTVTVIGCANAVGNSIPPYFVFKGKRYMSELMEGACAGAKGTVSETGWSNSQIFKQYLEDHFLPFANASRDPTQPIMLLYDGHTSHVSTAVIDWAKHHNIILFVLPPHTSHLLQPLDAGVFGPFKAYYHSECHIYMKKHIGRVITRYDMCGLACKAYLKAMSPINIQSAFRKTGVFPFSSESVSADKLYPAEVFREKKPIQKIMAMKSGKDAVEKFLMQKVEEMQSDCKPKEISSNCANKKQTVNKRPSPGGQAITEEPFEKQLKTYESTKEVKDTHGKETVKRKKNVKRQLAVQENTVSPKPSTSGVKYIQLLSDSDVDVSSDEEDIPETDLCCVCKQVSPPNINDFPNRKIVNWAGCDICSHWTHLFFCTTATVVRRHSQFLCPHCSL